MLSAPILLALNILIGHHNDDSCPLPSIRLGFVSLSVSGTAALDRPLASLALRSRGRGQPPLHNCTIDPRVVVVMVTHAKRDYMPHWHPFAQQTQPGSQAQIEPSS